MSRWAGAALLAVLVLTGCQKHRPAATGRCVADTKMDVYSSPVSHIDAPGYTGPLADARYTVNPPSGGDHLSVPVPPGVYEGAHVPPDGNLVHSLEHGYVIVWFKPASKDDLVDLADQFGADVLIVERRDMPAATAATAWGHRLLCPAPDRAALAAFIEAYRNQGPERIPH